MGEDSARPIGLSLSGLALALSLPLSALSLSALSLSSNTLGVRVPNVTFKRLAAMMIGRVSFSTNCHSEMPR